MERVKCASGQKFDKSKMEARRMVTCKFCGTEYSPRPQVKNPKACKKQSCQTLRQRSNEREWRSKNYFRFDGRYYRNWRKSINKRRNEFRNTLIEALSLGLKFREIRDFDIDQISEFFADFCNRLG